MPLSTLRPIVTARFQEANALLTAVAALESTPPAPDSDDVRALRGLLYVHMYAAFEYAMDQAFIRLAQHVSSSKVARKHLTTPIISLALEDQFKSLQDVVDQSKKIRKRIETAHCLRDDLPASIKDNVLSKGLQSAGTGMIKVAFEAYGLPGPHLFDVSAKGYIDEVVERRHAVAHGRESPIDVGKVRVVELRRRYDALYKQSIFVIDTINAFCSDKRFILPRHRRSYP